MTKVKGLISLAILLLVIFDATAQKKGRLQKANESYEAGEYYEAIEKYKDAYNNLSDKEIKPFIMFRMGECFRLTGYYKKAEIWYKKAIGKNYPDPKSYLHYANAMKANGKYEEAMAQFEKYKELVPTDKQGEMGIKSCEKSLKWTENPNGYKVEEMKFFNSKMNDYSPVFGSDDYSIVYFTSTRDEATGSKKHGGTGYSFADIFVSKRDRKGAWSEPIPLQEPINTEVEEGSCSFSSDYNTIYFSRCRIDKKDKLGCEIYYSSKKGDSWGKPEKLKITSDSLVVAHPSISNDDMELYFTSNMPGGYGGKDIYVIRRESAGGNWGEPKNLGEEINTPGNEVFPFIHPDGTLYFSSDYHIGMGGLDIFKATLDKESGKWKVKNMRFPVNSSSDDFGITFEAEKERGYFSSNRNGYRKSDEIFTFHLPPLKFSISGYVKEEKKEGILSGANVKLIGSDGTNVATKTNKEGYFKFMLKPKTDYILLASKEGFLNGKERETTKGLKGSKDFSTNIFLTSIDNPIELPNILYDFGKWDLRPESMIALDKLVETLNDNPNITIELGSHTDSRGSKSVNIELSQKRAESVVNYLIQNGINAKRLEAKGYASAEPRVVNDKIASEYDFLKKGEILNNEFIKKLDTEDKKEIVYQLNRRTEFKVLRTDYKGK